MGKFLWFMLPRLATHPAVEGPLVRVPALVQLQVVGGGELPGADWARELPPPPPWLAAPSSKVPAGPQAWVWWPPGVLQEMCKMMMGCSWSWVTRGGPARKQVWVG